MYKILLAFIILIAIAYYSDLQENENVRRPDTWAQVESLPSPSSQDPVLKVAPDKPCAKACRGSAFAVDDAGHYLTARHVVLGCRQLEVVSADGNRTPVRQVRHHPQADLSLLETAPVRTTALPLGDGTLQADQDGFHYGFPSGIPAEIHARLLGRAWSRQGDRSGKHAPIIGWAEVKRSGFGEGSLGGLSGGATLDPQGSVIGVTILESPRRGRVYSAAPESLQDLLQASGLEALLAEPAGDGRVISGGSFARVGDSLRSDDSVVRVYCWA